MYLYKAMEILINSNQINPLQPPDKSSDNNIGTTGSSGNGAATATTSVTDASGGGCSSGGHPINSRTSSSGQSSLVPPERRHSTSASDWSQNGVGGGGGSVLIKKNSVGVSLSNGSGHSRRHSLPNGNGCIVVPLKETNTTTTTDSSRHEVCFYIFSREIKFMINFFILFRTRMRMTILMKRSQKRQL